MRSARMRAVSPRDAVLVLLGAACMHILSLFLSDASLAPAFFDHSAKISINTNNVAPAPVNLNLDLDRLPDTPPPPAANNNNPLHPQHPAALSPPSSPLSSLPPDDDPAIDIASTIPETVLISHAPGWSLFRNLYMSGGTLFIVTSDPAAFPDISLLTSTGLAAENTPESIQARIPTAKDMAVITPREAHRRWGGEPLLGHKNRIFPIEGSTFLFNDPGQFLNHYYHFCAELLFGAWAFWSGTFASAPPALAASASALAEAQAQAQDIPTTPHPARIIFPHATAPEWRDSPGFNAYFLRAAFPSVAVETQHDWADRVLATSPPAPAAPAPPPASDAFAGSLKTRAGGTGGAKPRAWWFDTVLLADRSAAFRGPECGSRTQRTAAEALRAVSSAAPRTDGSPASPGSAPARGARDLHANWWEPVRRAVLRFAGVDPAVLDLGLRASAREAGGLAPAEVVVTYISRQSVRRRLLAEDHEGLVRALREVCGRRGWELNVVQAEKMTREEQVAVVARTTILLGVHGNGLTHLVMMPVTPVSTVIEIFYPGGFAHDYEWTARARGMRHFAIWNDTALAYPDIQYPNYPEGFQGTQIPVHGPHVARLIEDRVDGRLS